VARIEATRKGLDVRYVVTNITYGTAECWCGRPLTASMCQNEVVVDLRQRRPSVDQISRIGMDSVLQRRRKG